MGLSTPQREADGRAHAAVQVMLVLGLEHAHTELDNTALKSCTRPGPRDDRTLAVSAHALNGTTLAAAGHRLRSSRCSMWAPGFEQCEDGEQPEAVRRALESPRQRLGSLGRARAGTVANSKGGASSRPHRVVCVWP